MAKATRVLDIMRALVSELIDEAGPLGRFARCVDFTHLQRSLEA